MIKRDTKRGTWFVKYYQKDEQGKLVSTTKEDSWIKQVLKDLN